jgi:hypothetical protein
MAVSRLTQTTLQNGFEKYNQIWDGRSAVGSMEAISSVNLSSGQYSIQFDNIPSTYSHLQLRYMFKSSNTNGGTPRLTFNAPYGLNSTSDYAYHGIVSSDGSTVSAQSHTSIDGVYAALGLQKTGSFSVLIMDILDYANTSKFKTLRFLGGTDANGSGDVGLFSGLWRSTSAISSLSFTHQGVSGTFTQYSSFSLYGIK